MTTATDPQVFSETAIKREGTILRGLLKRIGNAILNRVFALNIEGSNLRRNMLIVLFLLAGFLITLPQFGSDWRGYMRNMFTAIFTNPAALSDAFEQFVLFLFRAVTSATTLHLLPVFVLPFILALHFASVYLADIFETEDINIARKFVSEVALMGGDNHLRIRSDKIDDAEIDKSPITQIGGPGYVTVDLDTAILLEKPDGRCRVIGPTHDQPGGRAVLDGFERIRERIDLRDQVPDPLEIGGRSRDGIPIGVMDVRVVFNIFRDNKLPTTTEPHPFLEESIRNIVYSKTKRVTDSPPIHQVWYRSAGDPIWVTPMKSLLTRELGTFTGKRDLGEYLASIGIPERQAEQQMAMEIARRADTLAPNGGIAPPPMRPAPNFAARPQLSALFREFTVKFNDEQRKRGVQAQWVGVGTWKMPPGIPSQVIPEKHLEAWRLTLENLSRGSVTAITSLQQEGELNRLLELIHEILGVHRQGTELGLNDGAILWRLIQKYRSQLRMIAAGRIPADLREMVNRILGEIDGIIHWVRQGDEPEEPSAEPVVPGPPQPPPGGASVPFMITHNMRQRLYDLGYDRDAVDQMTPERANQILNDDVRESPLTEEELYMDLLTKVRGDREIAERVIAYEQRLFPQANRREWLLRAIDRWVQDNR